MRHFSVKLSLLVCWVLVLCPNVDAQMSDLRQSREPLPGVSDILDVGISVELGFAQHRMNTDVIVDTLQSRLETLGYCVTLDPVPTSDGLWLQLDCQSIEEKAGSSSQESANQPSVNISRLALPCQLGETRVTRGYSVLVEKL